MKKKCKEANWIIRIRIKNKRMSLEQLSKATRLKPGAGSFSKGDPIPKWLQLLEKREKYDLTRLQISYDARSRSLAEGAAFRMLKKHFRGIEKGRRVADGELDVELDIECYDPSRPVYFLISKSLCSLCTKAGASIHYVFG